MHDNWAARHRHEVQAALASSAPTSIPDAEAGQAVVLLDSSHKPVAHSELAARLLAALPHRPESGDPPLVVTALAAQLTACRERPENGWSGATSGHPREASPSRGKDRLRPVRASSHVVVSSAVLMPTATKAIAPHIVGPSSPTAAT